MLITIRTGRPIVSTTCVDFDETLREEAAGVPGKPFALAQNDCIRAQIRADLRKDLFERTTAIGSNAVRRLVQVALRGHRLLQNAAHAWTTWIVSTVMPDAVSFT